MNQTRQIAAAVLISMLTFATWSQAQIRATPAPAEKHAADAVLDKVLPELSVEELSLQDFLNYLRDAVPGFQSVLVQN